MFVFTSFSLPLYVYSSPWYVTPLCRGRLLERGGYFYCYFAFNATMVLVYEIAGCISHHSATVTYALLSQICHIHREGLWSIQHTVVDWTITVIRKPNFVAQAIPRHQIVSYILLFWIHEDKERKHFMARIFNYGYYINIHIILWYINIILFIFYYIILYIFFMYIIYI